jgi:hypothetical protein
MLSETDQPLCSGIASSIEPLAQRTETVAILLPRWPGQRNVFCDSRSGVRAPGLCFRTPAAYVSLERRRGVTMSDCLHCDIHEMLDVHLQSEQADLGEIAARVTEVLADLILMAPPADQAMLLAAVVANLGGMVLEKNQEADPNSPRRSSH